ncbi:MAG: hypothetical protein J5548_12660 [Prevotella sp.]|nr:hypothetical protein [Prevotella sp.]
MKRFLFTLLAFLAIGSGIQAQTKVQDVIYVDDVVFEPGETEATIEIKYNIDNAPTTGIKGLQFELDLPEGFTLKENSRKRIIVNDVQEDFTVTTTKQSDVHKVRFMMISMVDNYLDFEDGVLFSLIVVADANVTVGTYPATVGGYGQINYIQMSGTTDQGDHTYWQDPLTFYLKMPIELSEENSYAEGFGNYTDVMVLMNKRTLKAGTWNTICFPFDMDEDAIKEAFGKDNEVTIATLTGSETKKKNGKVHSIIIKFDTKSKEISANTPYLLKLSEPVDVFAVDGVSLSDDLRPSSMSGGDCTFYGNYDVIENLGEDEPVLFISGNKFYYATGNTKMKSFRGYFTHTDLAEYIQNQSAGANITLFVDDEPTGIRNIVTNQGSEDVYDISGRKVNNDNLQKGVYIVNGKKQTVH